MVPYTFLNCVSVFHVLLCLFYEYIEPYIILFILYFFGLIILSES